MAAVRQAMTENPSNKERLYVTNEDIVSLASIGNDTVFAVTAPQGTSLVVPDPDAHADQGQPRQYRCAPTPSLLHRKSPSLSQQGATAATLLVPSASPVTTCVLAEGFSRASLHNTLKHTYGKVPVHVRGSCDEACRWAGQS